MADIGTLLGAAGVGGAIGQAIVRLELDTSKYSAEMKAAQAQTTVGANTMGGGLSKFAGLATAAFATAGIAAVAFGAFAVKAAIEANDAHLKLQNTFANNPKLADSSVAAFERQADALRDLTGTDDEAIIAGQALLGSFKLTGDQVQELTPLVVDLAAKYDIDLQTAFKAVGKATAGNAGVLSRYGVTLDETKLKTDAFGTTLKGLAVAQGFAADRAEAEPWRVLTAQFEEVAEQLGQALIPLIKNLTHAIITILPFIKGLITGFIQLGHYVSVVIDKIGQFYDLMGRGVPVTKEMVSLIGKSLPAGFQTTGKQAEEATHDVVVFFRDLGRRAKEFANDFEDAMHDSIFALKDLTSQSGLTEKDFIRAQRNMLHDAKDFARSLRDISREDWVNKNYVDFLGRQGPEFIVTFADLNERQQKKMQGMWERSNTVFDKGIKNSFINFEQILARMDNKTTKHSVEVHYKYVGFDPTKPGMSDGRGRPA